MNLSVCLLYTKLVVFVFAGLQTLPEVDQTTSSNFTQHPTFPVSVNQTDSVNVSQSPMYVNRYLENSKTPDEIMITTNNITDCFLTSGVLKIYANNASVFYSQSDWENANRTRDKETKNACVLLIYPPYYPNLQVTLEHQDCVEGNWIRIYKLTYLGREILPHERAEGSVGPELISPSMNKTWTGCEPAYSSVTQFTVTYGIVIELHVGNSTGTYALRMSTRGVRGQSKDLEVVMISDNQGYVQTPGWNPDDKTNSYPPYIDSLVSVTVPRDHYVMLSFLYLYLRDPLKNTPCPEQVDVHLDSMSWSDMVWRLCGTLSPRPVVYRAQSLHVHFTSKIATDNRVRPGFRLLFSFHKTGQVPSRIPDSYLWNCSVPSFQDFKHHVTCNAEVECLGGEDETSCPWELCGPGGLFRGVFIGGRCYSLQRSLGYVSHKRSRLKCLSWGGHLVSINTLEEWRDVTEVLLKGRPMLLHIGLRSASSLLPQIYRYAMQWEDASINYLHETQPPILGQPPLCGLLTPQLSINVRKCDIEAYANFLCEMEPDWLSMEQRERFKRPGTAVKIHPLTDPEFPVATVKCPTGHYTHTFLACDTLSDCFAVEQVNYGSSRENWDIPSSFSCWAPLTSLPPSFPCEKGGQRVPYTLVCDHRADCEDNSDESFCRFESCQRNGPFTCGNTPQCHTDSDWCDGQKNCMNGADEADCAFEEFVETTSSPPPALVDFTPGKRYRVVPILNEAKVLETDTRHMSRLQPTNGAIHDHVTRHRLINDVIRDQVVCPLTHFLCPVLDHCLPIYVRCNQVVDCPGREDELDCLKYVCPGFYRCRASRICLHPSHLCDRVFQCPQHDDELMCGGGHMPDIFFDVAMNMTIGLKFVCPKECFCLGLAFICPQLSYTLHRNLDIRYLDASGSGTFMELLASHKSLVHLSLSACKIKTIYGIFPNMLSLDLSNNLIRVVSLTHLRNFPKLKTLFLGGNPVIKLFVPFDRINFDPFRPIGPSTQLSGGHNKSGWVKDDASGENIGTQWAGAERIFTHFPISRIQFLDLSGIHMPVLSSELMAQFPYLWNLNLSGCGIENVLLGTFEKVQELRVLDMRGCPVMEFPQTMLTHLHRLQSVFADNYKLCCSASLPETFNINNCLAPFDEISSCEALLRSDTYRGLLAMFASLALLGNLGSFFVRVCVQKTGSSSSFNVFVTHLSVADFLMGVYLAIIGVADLMYRGTYLWEDVRWRQSIACQMAGFLSFLSNEVSALIIFLITLDRFLVLRFPLSQLHFRTLSAKVASCVAWALGVVMASLPLLPLAGHWQFYSQTGICIPLPITRTNFPGSQYSFAVMVVLNFVLFLLIAAGQASIYASVRLNSMAQAEMGSSSRCQDQTVARRLVSIAMSDFLCWFPIGLLGMLASQGVPVPGEVSVGLAIFVLPLNSALNPFLYTFNMILERRRRLREERMLKFLCSTRNNAKGIKETDIPR